MNEFRLAISVTHANGRVTRWGPDEPDGENIPQDLTFSTSVPGGFRDLSCSLLRRIDRTYPDEALFDDVTVYTAGGGSVVWSGRIAQLPRQHGDTYGVTPGAVGWSAHLKDDPSFREIYRDMDMTKWQGPNLARRAVLYGASRVLGDFTSDYTGQRIDFPTPIGNPRIHFELYYPDQGIPIERLAYRGTSTGTTTGWSYEMYTHADQSSFTLQDSVFLSSLDDTYRSANAITVRNGFAFIIDSGGNSVTPTGGMHRAFSFLAVMGDNTTLTLRGTEPDAGYYASDLINDIVSKAAPMLTRNGIETNTSVVPHAAFTDPVTGEDAISLINAYALWEWGVWEDRDFFYRAPSLDRTLWRARLSNGAKVDLEGDTAEQIFNGVYVTYQDASGQRKTVGPPGATADNTDSALEDTSDSNPVNSHGIPRRWARLDISVPTTLAGATLIGQTYLAERLLASRRGTITLSGTAIHPTKGERPVWEIRAGDSILIEDRTGDVARRVIQTDYRHANREVQLSCDNTSSKLDAILERLGVGLIGRF